LNLPGLKAISGIGYFHESSNIKYCTFFMGKKPAFCGTYTPLSQEYAFDQTDTETSNKYKTLYVQKHRNKEIQLAK
jgi:hypothetical protein